MPTVGAAMEAPAVPAAIGAVPAVVIPRPAPAPAARVERTAPVPSRIDAAVEADEEGIVIERRVPVVVPVDVGVVVGLRRAVVGGVGRVGVGLDAIERCELRDGARV